MATLIELHDFIESADGVTLCNKTGRAVSKKAQVILDDGASTVAEVDWAKEAIEAPHVKAAEILNYILSVNDSLSIATITAANDTSIQNNVNSAADAIIAGGV